MAALSELPHAHVKLSAFSLLGGPRDPERACLVVGALLERFGPPRCMLGSNFPLERLPGDFGSMYSLPLAHPRRPTHRERPQALAGTARRFYRLAAGKQASPARVTAQS